MLRVHFSGDDLGRVRVATRPDPLWETTLSLHRLQRGDGDLRVRKWRGAVRTRLPKAAGPLLTLVPPSGYFPDFLTPSGEDLDEQLDLVCRTERLALRRDLATLARSRRPTPWARDLGDANPAALGALTRAVRSYHRAAIEPVWNDVLACFDRQRARQARILLTEGVDGLLRGLSPAMRWKAPVLEVDYPVHHDLHLDGRGLLLIPSYFCWRTGVTLVENDRVPVLVHPIEEHVPETVHPGHGSALATLLGHTRAAVLETIEGGGRTSDVARRAGISMSSASQHATVLREAGLVLSTREGNTVRHHLTQLGSALLRKNL
ncbi:ArsR/SmtB family transcription factor [Amycolatopsis keratiniphila]|uniref:Putative ArsR family transcriptional regulator n=1 Tax=Amycolatopsis keratiniphila TaxID=129921 RepID=R4SNS5_9PSEU|nr:winged helix-turn-helix domain-containing protein [Amycolatopsis keratiniphila]AGM04325.1 putative ArsR family transcriptional regulator [Amycolatopsis keratiniphila]